MFGAWTRTLTHSTDAGGQRSAAIDAQLAVDYKATHKVAHILVIGPAGGGKSALLRLLAPGGDVPDVTAKSTPGDGGGVEEDRRSIVSSVTLAPSEGHVLEQQDAEEKEKSKTDVVNRRAADSINEIMLECPNTLRLLFTEVPSKLSRKVMHRFEGRADAIVYPLDLSSYADTAPPDPSASLSSHMAPASLNQLQASLELLESLLDNPRFNPKVVAVLLTKADRLAMKLQVMPFGDSFPAFKGDETVRGVAEYVLARVKQLNAYTPGRNLCVCPAVLNLAEEDGVRRAATRAGVLAFVTDIILAANIAITSCFCTGMPEEELAISGVALDEVVKGAWEGVVLEGGG